MLQTRKAAFRLRVSDTCSALHHQQLTHSLAFAEVETLTLQPIKKIEGVVKCVRRLRMQPLSSFGHKEM